MQNSSPSISIIIPTYNRCYIIWRALQSILQQTFHDFEVIVVDDGSTDDTARLIAYLQDSRFRYYYQENQGPSKARNTGIKLANGKYICYLDSDNYYYPNFLKYMFQQLEANVNKVLAYCSKNTFMRELTKNNNQLQLNTVYHRVDQVYTITEEKLLKMEVGADSNTIMHRKELAEEVGLWDESCNWLEDWDFLVRSIKCYPEGFLRVKAVLVDYEQVHGELADGICALARENPEIEIQARQYLLNKYADEPLVQNNRILWKEKLNLKKVRSK